MRISDWSSDVCSSDLAIMPVREKYSANVCAWTVEAPDPNSVAHIWAYRDLLERRDARDAAMLDPERSDERRVGKVCFITCSSLLSPYLYIHIFSFFLFFSLFFLFFLFSFFFSF